MCRATIFGSQQQQQEEQEENDLRQTPKLCQLPVAHVNTSPCFFWHGCNGIGRLKKSLPRPARHELTTSSRRFPRGADHNGACDASLCNSVSLAAFATRR